MTTFKVFFLALVCGLVTACASNPGVVQLSPDTYLLAKSDKAGIFGNAASFKAEVIREANSFAAAQGKVAIPIALNQTPVGPGRLATIEYQFRVLSSADPEVRRTSLAQRPDVVVESTNRTSIDLKNPAETKAVDVYGELFKLDELRKRGVLTDAEFEIEKKRLLSGR